MGARIPARSSRPGAVQLRGRRRRACHAELRSSTAEQQKLAPSRPPTYNPHSSPSVESHQVVWRTGMQKNRAVLMLSVLLLGYAPALAQDAGDVNSKIRKEEADNSQIMRTMHFLT